MPRYTFKGDRPVDVPEFGLEGVQPGDQVDVDGEIRHSDFELVQQKAKERSLPPTASSAPEGEES